MFIDTPHRFTCLLYRVYRQVSLPPGGVYSGFSRVLRQVHRNHRSDRCGEEYMLARQVGQAERTRRAAQVRHADLRPSRTRVARDAPGRTRVGMGTHGLRKEAENVVVAKENDSTLRENIAPTPHFSLDY